jgi:protein-disulfide isomerase
MRTFPALVIAASIAVPLALTAACGRAPDEARAGATAEVAPTVYRVPIDGAPALGDARAPVTLVAFSDYECPFCGRADALVAQLRKAYGPKLRTVMRQRPLPIHAHARAAALAALAAFEQGKFWPMHDRLFGSARSLDEETLTRLAGEAGLDVARWQGARAGAAAALGRDEALAATLGVRATPTFFINGRRVDGAQSIDVFKETIDQELARAEALTARGVRPEDVYATVMKDAVEKGPPSPPIAARPAPAAPGAAALAAAKPGCDGPGGDCGCNGAGNDDVETQPGPVEDVPVGAAPVRGDSRAPVTIVVYNDFECPFCKRSEATLRALSEQYAGNVRFAFKNRPLPMHASARAAAKAALAAGDQGKFWEYHDALFAHQDALDPASLERYAAELGLDVDRFRRTMAADRTEASIAADEVEATRLGVQGTPTFFVNGRRLIGAQPLERFQPVVELALADARR